MLNTLKTNLILTRAVLIALFAGLFILAACGGGSKAAPPTVEEDPDEVVNVCDSNPYGATCTRAVDATARATLFNSCRALTTTRTGADACENVPVDVITCLDSPLATACNVEAYNTARQGSGVELTVLEDTRLTLCRDGSNRNDLNLCTNAVVQNCDGDVSPFDLLCGRLNPERNAIIEKCVNGATLADSTKNADCVAARAVGFTCFDNPWAESCLTSTMYREFAAFRADAQESRLEYCMGDSANPQVCASALARVCSASGDGANPFSDLCRGVDDTYDSVRADFATNCFNGERDGADCNVTAFTVRVGSDALCGDGTASNPGTSPADAMCTMFAPVTVETCASAPFNTTCREVATFDNTRSALLDICTNGVPDGNELLCGTGGGFSDDETTCIGNPFTANVDGGINCGTLFTALGDENTLKSAQDNLIMACTTGADIATNSHCDSGVAGAEVAACLANPFETACDMTLGSETQATTAQNNIISLCTGASADGMNTICTGVVATTACLANPFDAACDTALGSPEQAETAQNNLIALCASDAITTNGLCTALTGNVKTCLDDPFTPDADNGINCGTTLGAAVRDTLQSDLIALCTGDGADGMNARCTTAATTTACLANPFTTGCDMTLGSGLATAQNNIISLCTGAGADGMNTICTGVVATTACLANPFDAACDATALGSQGQLDTAQSNVIALCASDAITTNGLCTALTGNVKTCLDDPFTPDADNGINCGTTLGAAVRDTLQSDLIALCTGDGADGMNARCTTAATTTACLANPFTTGCDMTLGSGLATAQNNIISLCTGAGADGMNTICTGVVATTACLANPFDAACDATALGSQGQLDTAQNNIIALCTTADSDNFNTNSVCTTIPAGNVKTCLDNPFTAAVGDLDCVVALGDSDAVARAQNNLIALCTGEGADGMNALCMTASAGVDVADCLANPFADSCDTALGSEGQADTAQANLNALCLGDSLTSNALCTDELKTLQFCSATAAGANPFNVNCDTVTDIDAADTGARAVYCDANADDVNCSSMTACGTNPFGTTCFFDGNRYDDAREAAITDCVPATDDTTAACVTVVRAEGADAVAEPLRTVASCEGNPFLEGCEVADFDGARSAYLTDCVVASPDSAACTTEVRAAGSDPMTDPAVTVIECFTNPFASGCDTLEIFADRRTDFFTNCDSAGDKATDANCIAPIGDTTTTVADCRADPFHADCLSLELLGGVRCTAQPFSTDCIDNDKYDGARCTANPFYADCLDNESYDVARCTADPFYMDCATDDTYDTARDAICTATTTSSIFNVNCTETAYTGTDAARKTFADGCRAGTTTTGCDAAVSDVTDAPTIADCNTNPYATGCDATVFADALTAYCADGADTIFNTNCDSRTGIATARSVAIGECVAVLTTNKSDASCTDREIVAEVVREGAENTPAVTVGSCLDDPFHASCTSDLFEFARDDHMEVCMSNGNANLPSCANIPNQACLKDPFLAACMTAEVGHTFRNARLARYAFCEGPRATSTALRALCGGVGEEAGTTIRNEICAYDGVSAFADRDRFNPFSSVCGANASAKIDYCGVGDNRNTQDACKDADFNDDVALGCLENPFAATCTGDSTINAAVKTRITEKRVAYCLAVDAEGFDATLCNAGTGDGVENEICNSQNANANPFANLCTRDGTNFDAARETFVKACAALDSGTQLTGGATCSAEVIACNTGNGLTTGCIDEPAYASLRQTTITACNNAVIADSIAGGGADTRTAICASITAAGYLECVTTNPYQNREAGAGVTALNCIGNADYAGVRSELEGACATTGGTRTTDTRCPVLLAGVCGTGTTASDAVAGTNPFNADFCFATNDAFAPHRKALVNTCDGSTVTETCTAEINACITNPFNTVVADGVSVDCTMGAYPAALVDHTTTYCGTGSTDNGGTVTANISLPECQTHAVTTLAGTNPCVANPFGEFEADVACDATHVGGDITAAQELRTTYCSGLNDSTSLGIRGDTTGSAPICLGAVENFCKGDNVFANTSGDGVFNCLSDDAYNAPRATQYALCNGDLASRVDDDCDTTAEAICTEAVIPEADPFAPICTETTTLDAGRVMSARQAIVAECAALSPGAARDAIPRCGRSLTDTVANNNVAEILATCDGDPRDAACDDYASAGQFYANDRVSRYVSGCADAAALVANVALCPIAGVQPVICVTNGANSRPFAPICGEGTVTNLETYKKEVLTYCLSLASANNQRCVMGTAPSTKSVVDLVKGQCGGSAPTNNPFNGAVSVAGVTGTLDCNTYGFFNNDRNTYATQCRNSITGYNCVGNTGALALICNASTGSAANPFDTTLCTTPDVGQKRIFADSCVGATAPLGNGATCPAAVIACATNPFTPTNCTDVAYNGQKTAVLDACKTSASIITGASNARCTTARDDVTCLKDPFNCTGTIAQFSEATGGAVQYLTDLTTDRLTYCGTGANINAQKTICRTASGPHSFCLANPFGTGCNNFLGDDDGEDFREDRIAFCFGDGSANANTAAKAVVTNRIGTARQALLTIDDVALCATPLTGAVTQYLDAIGFICYGSAVGATQTEAAATGDKSRDPFSAFCLADADYNARRAERILECANANTIGTTTTTVNSVVATTSTTLSCNWAQQVNLCAKSDTGTAIDAQCGTLNNAPKWVSVASPPEFTNDIATTANQFVRGTTLPPKFEYLNPAGEGTDSSSLVGAHSGAAAYGGLPNVTFFSARKKAVPEVIGRDAVTAINIGDALPGPDGDILTLGDNTVAEAGDVREAVDAVIAADAIPAGPQRFYATINDIGNVGRPVFNRNNPAAVWTGQIHWIGNGTAVLNHTNARTFKAQVNFAERTIEGAVSINTSASNPLGNHLVIDGDYTGAGIITGTTYIRNYISDYNVDAPNIGATASGANTSTGVVSGIIGHRGAVGAFISSISSGIDNTNGYAGGFAVCSTALVNNNCPQ